MLAWLAETFGLGGSLLTAAILLLVALYIRRALVLGGGLAAVLSSAATYVVVILASVGIAVAAGWVDPRPATIMTHVSAGASWGWEFATGPFRDLLEQLRDLVGR